MFKSLNSIVLALIAGMVLATGAQAAGPVATTSSKATGPVAATANTGPEDIARAIKLKSCATKALPKN